MSERNYWVICDDGCKFPAMTKEQILTAIEQAVEEGAIRDVDTGFVTTIKTINGTPLKFFVGTQSEYDVLTDAEKANLFAVISNDTALASIKAAIMSLEYTVNGLTNGTQKVAEAIYASALHDYASPTSERKIQIGLAGESLQAGRFKYLAAYEMNSAGVNTGRIKDVYPDDVSVGHATTAERFDIVGASQGTAISSTGLYLVEWAKASGALASGFLFISDLNRNVSTTESNGCCAYYEAYSKKILASEDGSIKKVFKLGDYSIGAGDVG